MAGARLTIEAMRATAEARGGSCLSPVYANSTAALFWRCAQGHEWSSTAAIVCAGHWCPKCGVIERGRKSRLTSDDLSAFAAARGGVCLSTSGYTDLSSVLLWRCAEGHEWSSKIKNVRGDLWCPQCAAKARAEKQKLALEQMQALAAAKGGACLSTSYVNSRTPLAWACAKGHTWLAVPNNVLNYGSWCMSCRAPRRKASP